MSLSFMVPATPAWLPFFFFFWLPLNLALVTSVLPSVLSWEPWEPSLKDRMASSGNQFSVLFSNFPLRVMNLSSWSSELILGSHWGIRERARLWHLLPSMVGHSCHQRHASYPLVKGIPVTQCCPLSRLRDPWIRVWVIWEWDLHAPHQLLALGDTGSTLQWNETT